MTTAADGRFRLGLRRLLPEWLKWLLRLVRLAVQTPPPPAPDLPQELLADCRFLSSRQRLLAEIAPDAVIVEVGSYNGDFSAEILYHCRPRALHLIDVSFASLMPDVRSHPAVSLHQGLSWDRLAGFPDETFDFIYIDADHAYASVTRDIAAALPKLKPGGLLGFNDFGRIVRPGLGVLGVHQAVCEFIAAHDWPVAYFCFHGEALYDIALRKPDQKNTQVTTANNGSRIAVDHSM